MKMKDFKEATEKVRPGIHWGIPFPHNFEMIREAGPEWLTKAFHVAGTLPRGNSVVSLKVHELSTDSCAAESMGGQGMKGWLEVEYEKPHPQLHTDLFVKLPFPYTPQNERKKNSFDVMPDESEILVNRLLGPAFPFKIPKYYFGDISHETSNYILISEKIAYKTAPWLEGGRDMRIEPYEIEPRIVKFKDYEMPEDGFRQYEAAMRALGRMVAAYHEGGLGSKELLLHLVYRQKESPIEGIGHQAFNDAIAAAGNIASAMAPVFGGEASVVGMAQQADDQQLTLAEMFASQAIEFVLTAKGIFPDLASDIDYLKQWFRETTEVAYDSWEVKIYVSLDPAFTSLLHGNLAADNAWYWRNGEGVLEAGLLDFGGCGHTNIAANMYMSWIMGEPQMLRDHWQDLARAFVEGVRDGGGPESITEEQMRVCVALSMASSNPLVGGNVQQLLKIMKKPEWAEVKDRWDPVVNERFLPRNYTCAIRTAMTIWRDMDLYGLYKEWRAKNAHWFPAKTPFKPRALPKCLA